MPLAAVTGESSPPAQRTRSETHLLLPAPSVDPRLVSLSDSQLNCSSRRNLGSSRRTAGEQTPEAQPAPRVGACFPPLSADPDLWPMDLELLEASTIADTKFAPADEGIVEESSVNHFGEKWKDLPTVGFSTAGGQPINISDEAISKAKALLGDMNSAEATSRPRQLIGGPGGLSTCTVVPEKDVRISEEAIAKAKALLGDDKVESRHQNADSVSAEAPSVIGFKTASETNFGVSKEAIAKAESFLGDCPTASHLIKPAEGSAACVLTSQSIFSTAGEESIVKALVGEAFSLPNVVPELTPSVGFATAGGKKITISKEAIAQAKVIMGNVMLPPNAAPAEEKSATGPGPFEVTSSVGFATAGGRKITISKEAIATAKALMGNVMLPPKAAPAEEKSATGPGPFEVTSNAGFATAGGRKITISKEAIATAKALMGNVKPPVSDIPAADKLKCVPSDNSEDQSASGPAPSEIVSKVGLATAGGKKVVISKESIVKATAFMRNTMAPTCRDDPVASGDTNYVLNKTVIRQSDEKNLPGHLDPLESYREQVLYGNSNFIIP